MIFYPQLGSFPEVGIYDSPQASVPKLIWTYWENLHQELRAKWAMDS